MVLGGDVTGKAMVPDHRAINGYWQVTVRGQTYQPGDPRGTEAMVTQIRNSGSYPAIVTPDELQHLSEEEGAVDERFSPEMTSSLDRWLDMADGKLKGGEIPCILNGGNDDIWEIDDIIEQSPCVSFGEGKVLDLAASTWSRWAGPTRRRGTPSARRPSRSSRPRSRPWRARSPDMKRTIFNFHAPPYGTGLGRGAGAGLRRCARRTAAR